ILCMGLLVRSYQPRLFYGLQAVVAAFDALVFFAFVLGGSAAGHVEWYSAPAAFAVRQVGFLVWR
ncbi:MAG: hypothetical protein OEY11_14620, partial [Gammaproteobacteria bacterium]|nr:hypothetical protein [Gammaproteobacteria bacterium]